MGQIFWIWFQIQHIWNLDPQHFVLVNWTENNGESSASLIKNCLNKAGPVLNGGIEEGEAADVQPPAADHREHQDLGHQQQGHLHTHTHNHLSEKEECMSEEKAHHKKTPLKRHFSIP